MGHQVCCQTSWNLREIEAGIAYFQPDLLVTVGFDKPMEPTLDMLPELCKKYRMLHIYWAVEDKIHFEAVSLPYVMRVKPDIVWTIHPECVSKYEELGFISEYFNFAYHPNTFPPKKDLSDEAYDISFVGTTHLETRTYRYESLKHLVFPFVKAGVELKVWGMNWPDNESLLIREFGVSVPPDWYQGYLPYKQTATVYNKSKIVLGVQNALDQVTQRTFEIMGTGAFMLASRTDELERLFKDGEHLALSSGPEETLEKAAYYLKRPEERLRIGRQAREKVLRYHTFNHRLAKAWPGVLKQLRLAKESGNA